MSPRTSTDEQTRIDDDPGDYLENDMEYEDFADELIEIEPEAELNLESRPQAFTAKQRIEIVREEQWLRSMLEDFGDIDEYDNFENAADGYVDGFSH